MAENFASRLDELMQKLGLTQRSFAEVLHLAPSAIAQAKRRGKPSTLLASAICSEFSVNRNWLEKGQGVIWAREPGDDEWTGDSDIVIAMLKEQVMLLKEQIQDLRNDKDRLLAQVENLQRRPSLREVGDHTQWLRESPEQEGRTVYVPLFDVKAAAGLESFVSEEDVETHVPYSEDWLVNTVGSYPKNVVALQVVGDSMEPKLHDGDIVLVDRVQHESQPVTEGVYLLRKEDDLLVKILKPLTGGGVEVSSYNPEYPPFIIGPEEQDGAAEIKGRVVWPKFGDR